MLWLVFGTALPVGTGIVVALLAGLRSRAESLLAVFIVAVAQVVVTLLFAGVVLESLSRGTVLAVTSVFTGATVVLARTRDGLRDRARQTRSSWVRPWPFPRWGDPLRRLWAWVVGAGVVAATLYLTLASYALPSYGYDAIWYHLTAVAAWIDGNRILITPLETVANIFPMNGELSFLWVGVLTRSDVLIDVPQIAFALGGALAVAAIARVAGVSRPGAVVAGSLYFLTPIVLAQASTNYVDLVLPGLFLAGFAFLFRYTMALARGTPPDPRRSLPVIALAGAGIGLAAGAKSSGLIYAGVALLVLVANLAVAVRRRSIDGRGAATAVSVFLVPMLALGSFWYVRAWVEYGNPVEPITVRVAGHELFRGLPRYDHGLDGLDAQMPSEIREQSAPLRPLYSWVNEPTSYDYQQRIGGLGWQWICLELPALLVLAGYCLWRRRALLANLIVPFVAIFLLQPAHWWSRLTVVIVAPGAIALVWIVEHLHSKSLAALLETATVAITGVSFVFTLGSLGGSALDISPADVFTALGKPRSERTLAELTSRQLTWTDHIPKGSRVGVAPEDMPAHLYYFLYGSDFRNHVVALDDRDAAEPGALVARLRREGIDYLYTVDGQPNDRAAVEDPKCLPLSVHRENQRLYRFVC